MKDKILEALKERSKENPITREELKWITGESDAKNRSYIGELRDEGYRVCGGDKGYFIATTEEDYITWRRFYSSYILKIARRIRAMDNYTEGQMRI